MSTTSETFIENLDGKHVVHHAGIGYGLRAMDHNLHKEFMDVYLNVTSREELDSLRSDYRKVANVASAYEQVPEYIKKMVFVRPEYSTWDTKGKRYAVGITIDDYQLKHMAGNKEDFVQVIARELYNKLIRGLF